jgi:inner membrane protein
MFGNLVAANLPDIDLVYAGITPAPLGYLLHHRGYTHTVVGLAGLGLVLGLVIGISPAARRLATTHPVRLLVPLALNLIGHVSLDAFNTYGVHPFYPFDARWYYGDAVFIFEPWLWILLGTGAICNAKRRLTRLLTGGLVAALLIAIGALGAVPRGTVIGLAVSAVLLVVLARNVAPRVRSTLALAAGAVFVVAMFGLSRVARTETVAAVLQDRRGEIVDVVLSPDPAVPACWTVIAIEEDASAGDIVLRRGTLSLLPARYPPSECVSRRFAAALPRGMTSESLAWSQEIRQPLARLRGLYDANCWVRAWLQFGRAPVIDEDRIFDLRFETGMRGNFTAMSILRSSGNGECPAHITEWYPPRADLLDGGR